MTIRQQLYFPFLKTFSRWGYVLCQMRKLGSAFLEELRIKFNLWWFIEAKTVITLKTEKPTYRGQKMSTNIRSVQSYWNLHFGTLVDFASRSFACFDYQLSLSRVLKNWRISIIHNFSLRQFCYLIISVCWFVGINRHVI